MTAASLKKIILSSVFILTMVFSATFPASATDPEKGLLINVKNIKEAKGSILVAIFDSEEGYMNTPAYSQIVPVSASGELLINAALPFGKYSITLFHDVNDNLNLDTNLFGIPKERYGFSNDAKAPFGPPSYHASSVAFEENGEKIVITLR